MKAKWLVLLALIFMLIALTAERLTALRVGREISRKAALNLKLRAAETRQTGRQAESLQYAEIKRVAADITAPQKTWQTDPTQLLRWFSEVGARANVRVLSSRILSSDRDSNLVAGGTWRRIRFELDLEGAYAPLVRYVDRVERAGQPMVVETFFLFADRSTPGNGKLKLFVSCLTPVPETKASK